jgi:acetyl esterase/lipase
MLTAQAVAWLLDKDLPLPGAVGMLGATGQGWAIGDSALLAQYVYGTLAAREDGAEAPSYFKGKDASSPLAAPVLWPDLLAQFPPSLLLTGSRAMEMSSMIDAHNKLTLAGARSRLHIWDGVGHCFYLDPDLPESSAAETIIIDFFAEHLGANDTDSGR